ncbi:hypothetical protein [Pseudarthrobacter sp. NamB4]|nr:hypothetical protein [Pseudarthrobacter sp. NamB4]
MPDGHELTAPGVPSGACMALPSSAPTVHVGELALLPDTAN